MRKRKLIWVGIVSLVVILGIILTGCGEDLSPRVTELEGQVEELEDENAALKEFAGPLPASLDEYFPPQAQGPVYLFEMFALEGPFGGIMGDLQQGDMEGVTANFQAFKEQYEKIADLVPEWTALFPMDPVNALGDALQSGDPSKVGPAMGEVGAVCGNCHLRNMVKVQQKYHWPDFHDIEIENPLSGETENFMDYMFAISGTFGAIANDLQQGQLDNARNDFQAFDILFDTLAEKGCSDTACHGDSPRTYFVDQSVLGMIGQLGQVLNADSPDPVAVAELSGGIGNESCIKCHMVHVPSALGKERLELFEELFD